MQLVDEHSGAQDALSTICAFAVRLRAADSSSPLPLAAGALPTSPYMLRTSALVGPGALVRAFSVVLGRARSASDAQEPALLALARP